MANRTRLPEHASPIEQGDVMLEQAVAHWRESPAMRFAAQAAELADQPPLFAICASTIGAGLLLRRPRLVRAGLRMLATEMVATGLKAAVKHRVARTRPHKARAHGRQVLHADPDGDKDVGPWNSFPSGHTAGAVGVARAVAREYPQAAPFAAAAALGLALVQVPSGSHYPSDVAAGAALGLAAEALVDHGVRLLGASDITR